MSAGSDYNLPCKAQYYWLIVLIVVTGCPVFAQQKLSQYELDYYRRQGRDNIEKFENYTASIAQERKNEIFIELAEDLFVPTATVQVGNGKTNTSYPVHRYLSEIVPGYKRKYQVVVLKFGETKISKLVEKRSPSGEIYYEGEFSFTQYFCVKRTGTAGNISEQGIEIADCNYADETVKSGKVIVRKIARLGKENWILKLSDIHVDSVTRLK
jgi:hypothetical protein